MNALIPPEERSRLHATLTCQAVSRLQDTMEALALFEAAPPSQRKAVARRIAMEYAPRGLKGLSEKRLYAKLLAFRRREALEPGNGWRALIPAHALRVAEGAADCISSKGAFIRYWQKLVTDNQRVTSEAYRDLFTRLRLNASIPDYGTWRDIWRAERPGRPIPEDCPYLAHDFVPAGWSLANLSRHKGRPYTLVATRVGTMAAANLLPQVIKTRVGLKRGQIVQIDDMWHDVKVVYDRTSAERVVEFSMVDVATGCLSAWVYKPIRKRDNGTKETLPAKILMAYLVTHWLVEQGYCPDGALICGEHGTSVLDDRLAKAIDDATGKKVRFSAGGKLSVPLAKGLYEGVTRGNFRFKALLEGLHSLKHNALAALPGQVGHTRATAPEELGKREAAENALLKAANALSKEDPRLYERMRHHFVTYADFCAVCDRAYADINARTHHALEGWAEQGFVTGTFRRAPGEPWQDLPALDILPQSIAAALMAEMDAHPENFNTRRLSPSEAWDKRAGDVIRVDRSFVPLLLGKDLACEVRYDGRNRLTYKDPNFPIVRFALSPTVTFGGETRLLDPGKTYAFWVNPVRRINPIADVAEVTAKGEYRYLGTTAVLLPARQDDTDALGHALGIRSKVQALEHAALTHIAQARVEEKAAIDAHNRDQIAAAKARLEAPRQPPRKPPAKVLRSASMDDLI